MRFVIIIPWTRVSALGDISRVMLILPLGSGENLASTLSPSSAVSPDCTGPLAVVQLQHSLYPCRASSFPHATGLNCPASTSSQDSPVRGTIHIHSQSHILQRCLLHVCEASPLLMSRSKTGISQSLLHQSRFHFPLPGAVVVVKSVDVC